jgi:ABC-type nitrate/sulfonate/bicarbonate transport system substrate-binding protein
MAGSIRRSLPAFRVDVTIRQGGPQLNTGQMLAAGAIDFRVGGGSGGTINFVQNDVPAMAVAAIFQKEAAVLIAHPGAGINSVAVGLIGREHRHHAGDAHFIDALHPVKIFA